MRELIATNPKRLDLAIRLAYAEHVAFHVDVRETKTGKIYYAIVLLTDEQNAVRILEKYRILTE